MSVQLEKLEHNMAILTVEVADEDFENALERAYKKNKNKINMFSGKEVGWLYVQTDRRPAAFRGRRACDRAETDRLS